MDKGTFIKRIAFLNRKPQPTKELYNKVLNDLINGIKTELAAGREVYFQGLGTWPNTNVGDTRGKIAILLGTRKEG